MRNQRRYVIGGYEGDQLAPLVKALIDDATMQPDGIERLGEIVIEVLRGLLAAKGVDHA